MRKLLVLLMVASASLISTPIMAADFPDYPDVVVPEVDYGLEGSFYLRGSAAVNLLWTREHVDTTGVPGPATAAGYGYSIGAGFGYEVGNGLRTDLTVDYLSNDGLTDGTDVLHLRSTIALANFYYDFPLSGTSAMGGFGAYVGAGLGGGYYAVHVDGGAPLNDGIGWTAAAAAMAGVTYDTGSWVADLGYRLIYLPQLSNNDTSGQSWYLNDNTVHELRASLRYRIN